MVSKLVVVTGASSGIGEATAKLYGGRGAHVALLARNADRLAAVAGAIRERGGTATPYTVDLSDRSATEETAARIARDLGTPDILVNNAGGGRWLPLVETTAEEALAMIEVPYLAGFILTRAFLPAMLARRSGAVAFITSPASYLAWPRASAYIAARRAVAGLAETLQSELKGTGLVVSLVVLGAVETPYWQHNPGSRANLPKTDPRFLPPLTPDQAASAIVESIAAGKQFVVKPTLFRALFVLNALFPRLVARQIRRATRKPSASS
ncbi:MAG: SDR family NAD(P)-dependent oxidoreductase [Methyloceanibacter sp.]